METPFRRIASGLLLTALVAAFGASSAMGGGLAALRERYAFSLRELTRGLTLPLDDDLERFMPPPGIVRDRIANSAREETIEPIKVYVPRSAAERSELVERLARDGREEGLKRYLSRKLAVGSNIQSNAASSYVPVDVDQQALSLIDVDAVRRRYTRQHHHLTVSGDTLQDHPRLVRALLEQLRPYMTDAELSAVLSTVRQGDDLDVDKLLLPDFARQQVKRFVKFRGPNCFYTALAFQDPLLPTRPDVNVKREPGYHRAMINNDELWWVLAREFDEIDPRREHMRYGDVLVYIDVADLNRPVDYRWVKHAATYLFNDYTFSKASNSPDSPFSVKTLEEEWDAWAPRSERLGVKVFRYRR